MSSFVIPGTATRGAKVEKKNEWNTQLFGSIETTKTAYNQDAGCDMYVNSNIPTFVLGQANKQTNEGFDTVEDAYNAIKYLAKVISDAHIPVKFNVHIAQNTETKKFHILRTVTSFKNKDDKK